MSKTENIKAIVLSRRPFYEDDCLVLLYAQKYGKIFVRARAAQKSSSKLRGHLEFGRFVRIMISESRTLRGVLQIETIENFVSPFNRLFNIYIFAIVELISIFGNNEYSEDLLEISVITMQTMRDKARTKKDCLKIIVAFVMRLLIMNGICPQTRACALCMKKSSFEWFFSVKNSGLVCDKCKCEKDIRMTNEMILAFNQKNRISDSILPLLVWHIEWHFNIKCVALRRISKLDLHCCFV